MASIVLPMSMLSPFAGLDYVERDNDLVRFRDNPIDETLSTTVRSIFDALDERRDDARSALSADDRDLLTLFARRRALRALRDSSARALSDALDAYGLLPQVSDVSWESWFKATLVIGRDLGLDLDELHQRFVDGATTELSRRAAVAFDAVERITQLAECHVIEVATTYGVGLFESTVIRDQTATTLGGLTGRPVILGQFQVGYAPTTNLAQLCVDVADALDATGLVATTALRHDQLVGSTFDLVTSGTYLDSLGCLSFFADGVEGQPSFSVQVAELATEEHYDTTFAADDLAAELAEAADAIEEQAALATGPCVVVLSALPDFAEEASGEPVDLSAFLEVVRGAPEKG